VYDKNAQSFKPRYTEHHEFRDRITNKIGGKEMERKTFNTISVLVVGIMIAAVFAPIGSVVAPVGKQHNIYWSAEQGPNPGSTSAAADSEITAWIDGVSYGKNTTDTQGKFDLYVDGDTWGLEYDYYKSGGYTGDLTQYFLDYDPMQYEFDIAAYTSSFIFGDYENETVYFDTETESDSYYQITYGDGDTFLRGLKINEIVLDPNDGMPQYVYILDPMNQLAEAEVENASHGYYLQQDDPTGHTPNGPIFDFNVESAWVIKTGAYYYINLSGYSLDTTAGELKLVWKNPKIWGSGEETADNIANGTDVIVDRVEWGNHTNANATDYDNTTMVDVIDLPGAGQSLWRQPAAGDDTDDCYVDFTINPVPTPRLAGPAIAGTPGSPKDLRVHKGGGAWGGGANDIVLNWTAPSMDYNYLNVNILYYDTDFSDGFQYSIANMIYFEPNSTAANDPDWCILPGWLADANNYVFRINTSYDFSSLEGSMYENMIGTNVGYKYGISLQKTGPTLTNFLWISLPYYCDYTKASDIAGPEFADNSTIEKVSRWDYDTQSYEHRTWVSFPFPQWSGEFTINPGETIAVTVTAETPVTWNIVGAYDDTLQFTLIETPPDKTNFYWLSFPYHRLDQKASEITDVEFADNSTIEKVSQWVYATQSYEHRTWVAFPFPQWSGEFTINASPGDAIAFTITADVEYYYMPEVMSF
jgi:hypothetical protein